jgi:hypothetical protein
MPENCLAYVQNTLWAIVHPIRPESRNCSSTSDNEIQYSKEHDPATCLRYRTPTPNRPPLSPSNAMRGSTNRNEHHTSNNVRAGDVAQWLAGWQCSLIAKACWHVKARSVD